MSVSTKNYSEQDTELLKELYEQFGNEGLDEIATRLGKTLRSVRAKLVKEQIYTAPAKKDAQRKNGKTKKEIIRDLENLGVSPEGGDGATKEFLTNVKTLIESIQNG